VAPTAARPQDDGVASSTVLIIEDNEDIRMLLDQVLSLAGYRVVHAAGGRQALTLLREIEVAPDLAILDVEMPDVSGWEVLRAIRDDPATNDLPVIVCTVCGSAVDLDTGRELRCDGYVQKPFDVDLLVDEVEAVIDGRPIL
jgi:DNA-binding response OmpR family regulator